jgi:hypothetical protein
VIALSVCQLKHIYMQLAEASLALERDENDLELQQKVIPLRTIPFVHTHSS